MKNRIIAKCILLFPLVLAARNTPAETAEEIAARADERMDYESAYIEASIVNTDRFGSKTITYKAWAEGSDFLMEFTSTAERGQKILRTADRIYHFFPESELVFTRSRGDEILGLISYEDLTDEAGLLENYEVDLDGEEELNGIPCRRLTMQAKRGKRLAYPRQTVWIEAGTYIIRRIEMFTRTGQPLKTAEIRKVEETGGKLMATDILLTDEVRRGSCRRYSSIGPSLIWIFPAIFSAWTN